MTDKIANLSSFQISPAKIFLRVFVVVFLLVVLASVTITFLLPESYASTARIKVEQDQAFTNQSGGSYDPYFIQTAFEIMQSQLVLNSVIDKLNLNYVWGEKYFNGEMLKTNQTLEILKARLQLTPVRNTMLINITVYSDDKKEAAQIANAIAESYRDFRFNAHDGIASKFLAGLQQEYHQQETQIQQAQIELDALREKFKVENEVADSQASQEQPYWNKKRDMGYLLDLHKTLFAKVEAAKLAVHIPTTSPVQITDTAEPGRAPVKPNKTVNIVLGTVVGIVLALAAGAAFAFLASYLSKRTGKTVDVGGVGASGVSNIALNLNTAPKTKRSGMFFYGIAAILVLTGVALNVSGSVHTGTSLISFGIAVALSAAARFGHLPRW